MEEFKKQQDKPEEMRKLAEEEFKNAENINFNELIGELNEGTYCKNDHLAYKHMGLGIKRLKVIDKGQMRPFCNKPQDATHITSLIQVYLSFDEMKRYFMEK